MRPSSQTYSPVPLPIDAGQRQTGVSQAYPSPCGARGHPCIPRDHGPEPSFHLRPVRAFACSVSERQRGWLGRMLLYQRGQAHRVAPMTFPPQEYHADLRYALTRRRSHRHERTPYLAGTRRLAGNWVSPSWSRYAPLGLSACGFRRRLGPTTRGSQDSPFRLDHPEVARLTCRDPPLSGGGRTSMPFSDGRLDHWPDWLSTLRRPEGRRRTPCLGWPKTPLLRPTGDCLDRTRSFEPGGRGWRPNLSSGVAPGEPLSQATNEDVAGTVSAVNAEKWLTDDFLIHRSVEKTSRHVS